MPRIPLYKRRHSEGAPSRSTRFITLPSKPPKQLKDWEALHEDITNTFLRDIRTVQQHAKQSRVGSNDSIYTGLSGARGCPYMREISDSVSAGIAFMEYYIASTKLPLQNEILTAKILCSVADKNLVKVLQSQPINVETMYSPSRLSFIETSIGIATLVLVRGLFTSEKVIVDNWRAALELLEYTLDRALSADDQEYSPGDKEDGCEVLYGRAGLLYSLLYLRKATMHCFESQKVALHNLISDGVLSRLVDSIMARGRHGGHLLSTEFRTSDADGLPPLMWTWHGKRYLGGAHGVGKSFLQTLLPLDRFLPLSQRESCRFC